MIIVVPVFSNVADPVAELMLATVEFDEVQVALTVVPELFVARKLAVPELSNAVAVPEPDEVQPTAHVTVRPPLLAVPTVSTVLPLTPL